MEVKRSSLLHQNPKLAEEKAFFSRANRGLEPREKDKVSKCYQQKVVVRDSGSRPLFPPKSSGHYQKPWPTKVSVRTDELVKHMSNVPCYLQCAEKGDNLQEKALNFGVLDWQRLEKWKGDHRHAIGNEKAAVSPASSNASSSFSMLGSSGQSCRSSGSSYVAKGTQSPSLNRCQDSSTEEDYKRMSDEEISWNRKGCSSPEIAHRRCPIRHHISHSAEKILSMDNLAAKFEESKQKDPEFHSFSDDVGPSPEANSSPPKSKDCAISNFADRKMKLQEVVSDHREKRSGELGYKCPGSSLCTDDDFPENCSEFSQPDDGILGHFQKRVHSSRRFSFGSTESDHAVQTEPGCGSPLGTFPSEGFQFATFSLGVAHSCRFPCDIQSECSDVNICEGSEVSCDSTNSPTPSAAVATVRSNCRQEENDKFANSPHNNSASKTSEKWDWNELKPVNPRGRDSVSNNHSSEGSSGMIRSSSLRESPATRRPTLTSLDRHTGGKAADSSRGRRSPLRRLLDPLLKPKALYRARPARLVAGSINQSSCQSKLPIQEEPMSTHGLHSSFNTSTNSSGDDACDKGSLPTIWVPPKNHGPAHDMKHETSTKQALLRLAWKNGLPLFTFSVNESDILAATRRKGTSVKQDYDYIYTFYYVHEIKKKTGGWISQGNRGKRKELVSRVVGQMNVSGLRCAGSHITAREFTLFGPELRPKAHKTPEPVPNNELAAIVVRVPEENLESAIGDMPQENNCEEQSKAELKKDKYACQPVERPESGRNLQKNDLTIVAILPSEVHGLSDGGKPSPLVDRWKSGGLCDCGGWDVGCSLSILTNKLHESGCGVVQSCHTTDGSHRVELFIQGGDQGSGAIFSLVAFKEELYTVHFHESIASLQAFAVCVALLHSRKHTGPHELQDLQSFTPVEASPMKNPAKKQVEPSSMSVPYHPPVSPVGRA